MKSIIEFLLENYDGNLPSGSRDPVTGDGDLGKDRPKIPKNANSVVGKLKASHYKIPPIKVQKVHINKDHAETRTKTVMSNKNMWK